MTKQLEHKPIHWGIIGLGSIASKFATDLLTLKDAKLYGVASRSQHKADLFASKYYATKAYASYEALVQDKMIDAIYIATPHTLHKDNTILCLAHGKAVLCEKPFAMNAQQVQQMITLAKEKNVLLMEALWTYFLPHYKYILDTIKQKTFGSITKLEANFGFYRAFNKESRLFNKSLGGGSLLDIGIYPIFAALSTLGIPENIKAKATYFENGVDSSCDMTFEYDNKVKAKLKSTLLENTSGEAIFYFEKGIIKINGGFHAPTTLTITLKDKEETIDFDYKTIGYNYETVHFNHLLRQGKTESDVMTFEFSKNLMTLLDKVRRLINLNY